MAGTRRWARWCAAGIALALGAALVGAFVLRRRPSAPRATILAAARRVSGDVVLLSTTNPFPKLDEVLAVTERTAGVRHASVFAVGFVRLETVTGASDALLKLEPLDAVNARELGLAEARALRPRSESELPEIAIGVVLAGKLGVAPGAVVTVRVAPPAGTTGAAVVQCKAVSFVELGLDNYDQQMIVADWSHVRDFALLPTGIDLRLESPAERVAFAGELQRWWGPEFIALPLEQLIAPLLGSDRR